MERLETTGPVFGGGRSSVLTVIFSPTFCSGSVAGSNAAVTVGAAGGWERCASAGANKTAADWTVSVVMRKGTYFISNSLVRHFGDATNGTGSARAALIGWHPSTPAKGW